MQFLIFSAIVISLSLTVSASPIPIPAQQSACNAAAPAASSTASTTTTAAAGTGGNLQPFTGTLGGAATPVTNSGDAKRPFQVKADTFVNIGAALQRSCDQQFNACANQANAGGAGFTVSDCSAQQTQCTAADAGVTA